MPLPRCFFDVSINGVPTGRIVFELFKEDCPRTTENFRCLCTGEKGEGRTTFKPLHFKGTPIHRIVKGFIIQGGDFSSGDGTGGESIYGGMFKDENFKHRHDKPFLLSMANKGPNTNGSQFFITTRPAPHLDGIHVVFGRVVSGSQFVSEVENQKVDANHRPYADIRITHSGELVLLKKKKAKAPPAAAPPASSESSSSLESSSSSESESESETDSEEEERRKKKRLKRKKRELLKKKKRQKQKEKLKALEETTEGKGKKKRKKKVGKEQEEVKARKRKKKRKERQEHKDRKKKRVKKKQESESESNSEENDSEMEPVTSTVPEVEGVELPEEIRADRTSWLHRRSCTPSPKEQGPMEQGVRLQGKKGVAMMEKNAPPIRKPQSYKPVLVNRDNEVSHSGRILKGRGTMMYRTPPPDGEADDLRSDLQFGHGREGWGSKMMMDREEYSGRFDSRCRRSPPPRGPTMQRRGRGGGVPWAQRKTWRDRSPQQRDTEFSSRDFPRDEEKRLLGREQGRNKSNNEGYRRTERRRGSDREDAEESRASWSHHEMSQKSHHHHRTSRESPVDDQDWDHGKKKQHRRRWSRSSSRSSSPGDHRKHHRERKQEHHHHRNSRDQHRREGKEAEPTVRSKWARHHDQESDRSSSEEDREIERAFQQKRRKDSTMDGMEDDLFGIDKFLPVP